MAVKYVDQMDTKFTNIFHCKPLQNLSKVVFLVWKYTIWQPWSYFTLLHGLLRDRDDDDEMEHQQKRIFCYVA
jgi:hypothetical protein